MILGTLALMAIDIEPLCVVKDLRAEGENVNDVGELVAGIAIITTAVASITSAVFAVLLVFVVKPLYYPSYCRSYNQPCYYFLNHHRKTKTY